MKKTTRTDDLNSLEEAIPKAKTAEGKIHRKAILEAIYEQMKDGYLEKMRIALIDALKRGDILKYQEIKKKVEDYARSPKFIKQQIKARKRISTKEAGIWLVKEVIKNGKPR